LSVRKLVYGLAALPAVAVIAAVAACGPAGARVVGIAGDLTLEQARAFAEFPLVYAGERVDGLALVAIVRRDDTADYVSFVYGDCRPLSPEGGCAPPAEIQVWPADRRSRGSYDTSPGALTPELTRIRGSPAAFFDAGTRLEIYTAEVTVVVFARSRERAGRIAAALRCLAEGADTPADSLAC
jgi:hypothetical protein